MTSLASHEAVDDCGATILKFVPGAPESPFSPFSLLLSLFTLLTLLSGRAC
jgi:hypothetical protein